MTGSGDTWRSLAEASAMSSRTPSTTSTAAKIWNTVSVANHTTPTVIAISAAPLRTRVIGAARAALRLADRDLRPAQGGPGLSKAGLRPRWRMSLGAERHRRRLDAAVAAIAFLVRDHGLEEVA